MSDFTVRIELQNAEWADDDCLHATMEARGFRVSSDPIIGNSTTCRGRSTMAQLSLAVHNSATLHELSLKPTGRKNAVLVTECVSRAWIGLEEAYGL